MSRLLAACLTILVITFNSSLVLADTEINELPECIILTHCVRENWEVTNVTESFLKTVTAVGSTPRTKIIEQTDSYLHAEAITKWRRYTDDLLIKALPEKSIIQVRSESRVGVGDNGVNQKRVDDLKYRLITNQIN